MATVKELLKKLIAKTEVVTTPKGGATESMARVVSAAAKEGERIKEEKGKQRG